MTSAWKQRPSPTFENHAVEAENFAGWDDVATGFSAVTPIRREWKFFRIVAPSVTGVAFPGFLVLRFWKTDYESRIGITT